ncbi:hypothetical protein SOJ_27660 [Staphylococcus sp. OJ82]|uniref:hypothetical protein n=1 Tax=Staphylococcus sp. OJ82 TaxID=1202667 RepID=UPI000281FB77|nr:hypothetical protein [Staphylococcus sp. OJ82]EJX16599.1 hypothetical protein SOJ_27660 [Staphylococcus sp. OJ82]
MDNWSKNDLSKYGKTLLQDNMKAEKVKFNIKNIKGGTKIFNEIRRVLGLNGLLTISKHDL